MKTPASILFDVTGIPTAVSASTQPLSGALGHVMAGFDETNTVRYAKFDVDSLKVTGSVTVLGDNGVALQQDANDKLIVIDTDVSGAINDTKLSLSSSIDDLRLTLSGAISQVYTELNSGDVDIRSLTFSTDSVTAYQGGVFSVTGSGDVGLLRQDVATRDLYVTGSVLVTSGAVAITDNTNGIANIETIGTRKALAVEYPILLDTMNQILVELKRIRRHMESITEEEWSENDDI